MKAFIIPVLRSQLSGSNVGAAELSLLYAGPQSGGRSLVKPRTSLQAAPQLHQSSLRVCPNYSLPRVGGGLVIPAPGIAPLLCLHFPRVTVVEQRESILGGVGGGVLTSKGDQGGYWCHWVLHPRIPLPVLPQRASPPALHAALGAAFSFCPPPPHHHQQDPRPPPSKPPPQADVPALNSTQPTGCNL